MAIAISDANLKEIYALSTEDKLDLVDMIIRSIRSAANKIKVKPAETESSWVSQFEGQWKDSKSADEMVMDQFGDGYRQRKTFLTNRGH